MTPTVQVALIGIISTLITTLGVIVVAVVNNRRERDGSASEGVEATLRERVAFTEAKNVSLSGELLRKSGLLSEYREENKSLREENRALRREVKALEEKRKSHEDERGD